VGNAISVSRVMRNMLAVALRRNNGIEAACKPFMGIVE
jgi:hypothetical protein